jgi:hypothetical protein
MVRGRLILFAALLLAASAPASASASPGGLLARHVMDWSSPLRLDSGSPSQFHRGSGIDCVGESFCAAAGGEGTVLVSTDPTGGAAAWKEVAIEEASAGDLTSVSCPSASFCAAVDDAGHLLTSSEPAGDATTWSAAAIDPGRELVDVSCPSAGFCAAIDDAGNALVSDAPAGGAAAWESTQAQAEGGLSEISCASASLCAIAYNARFGASGLLVSTDPLTGAGSWADAGLDLGGGWGDEALGVSCPSNDFCGFAYAGGILVSSDPAGGSSAWHLTQTPSRYSYVEGLGITCSSADFCLAQLAILSGSSYGPPVPKLLISSQPASPGSWTEQDIDWEWPVGHSGLCNDVSACATGYGGWRSGIAGIDCTGPTFCATVAADGSVSTSTDPAGGSEAWDAALTGRAGPSLTSVSCPSASFCAATGTQGRLYTSTDPSDPGGWTATRLAEYVESVTCSSPAWCTVAAAGPTVMYSTEPGAGASAWSAVPRPTGRSLTCPEPGFCAELADRDEVLASNDPIGGGAGSWVRTDMRLGEQRLGPAFLSPLSCPSADLCATGGGSNGAVFTSADPTGPRSGWIAAAVGQGSPPGGDPNVFPNVHGVDCPQTRFCAVTASGGIDTTTTPLGGRGAWTFAHAPDLGAISCAENASLCVALDQDGNAVTSRSPQHEISDWGILEPIYEGEGLRDVSCAVDGSLCAVISEDGEVIVGARRHRALLSGWPLAAAGPLPLLGRSTASSGGRRSRTRCGRPLRTPSASAARSRSCRWDRG